MSKIDYINLDLSPLEDEGIDYIWFARYLKDNFIKFESNNDKIKSDFDSIYNDRKLIREFGLIGKSRKISFYLNDGLFKTNTQDIIHLYIETENNQIINISNNLDCSYDDIISKKSIKNLKDNKLIISPISFGYNTEIKYQKNEIIKANVLYNIYNNDDNDHKYDDILIHLTTQMNLENASITLVHPYFEFKSNKIKLNKIDDINYEQVLEV